MQLVLLQALTCLFVHLPLSTRFSKDLLHSCIPKSLTWHPSSPEAQGDGEWGAGVSPQQLLSATPSSSHFSSAPTWSLHRLQLLSGHVHLPWCGVLHRLQCGYLLQYGPLHGILWITCSTIVSPTGYRGMSSPVGTWITSNSSFPDLGISRIVSHAFSPHCTQNFLPFLKYVFPKVPSPWLRGSAMPCRGVGWSWLELSVSGTGQPWPPLTEATPAAPHCQHLGTCTWCMCKNSWKPFKSISDGGKQLSMLIKQCYLKVSLYQLKRRIFWSVFLMVLKRLVK